MKVLILNSYIKVYNTSSDVWHTTHFVVTDTFHSSCLTGIVTVSGVTSFATCIFKFKGLSHSIGTMNSSISAGVQLIIPSQTMPLSASFTTSCYLTVYIVTFGITVSVKARLISFFF